MHYCYGNHRDDSVSSKKLGASMFDISLAGLKDVPPRILAGAVLGLLMAVAIGPTAGMIVLLMIGATRVAGDLAASKSVNSNKLQALSLPAR